MLVHNGQELIDRVPWTRGRDHIRIANVKAADDLLAWFHAQSFTKLHAVYHAVCFHIIPIPCSQASRLKFWIKALVAA